jgi:hypothetical protein
LGARDNIILIKMEQKSVQCIFDKAPDEKSKGPICGRDDGIIPALEGQIGAIRIAREPEDGNHPPRGLCERLEEVAKEGSRLAALVVAWTMHLVKVELLGKVTVPELGKQRLAQIQKLVFFIVLIVIRVLAKIFFIGHASSRVHILAIGVSNGPILLWLQVADQRIVEDVICSI